MRIDKMKLLVKFERKPAETKHERTDDGLFQPGRLLAEIKSRGDFRCLSLIAIMTKALVLGKVLAFNIRTEYFYLRVYAST